MRKVVIIATLIVLASCSNVSNEHHGDSVSHDTSFKGAMITDSAGSSKINADTSGMSEAR